MCHNAGFYFSYFIFFLFNKEGFSFCSKANGKANIRNPLRSFCVQNPSLNTSIQKTLYYYSTLFGKLLPFFCFFLIFLYYFAIMCLCCFTTHFTPAFSQILLPQLVLKNSILANYIRTGVKIQLAKAVPHLLQLLSTPAYAPFQLKPLKYGDLSFHLHPKSANPFSECQAAFLSTYLKKNIRFQNRPSQS